MNDELPSCDVCFKTDLKLLACSQCHVARYCSQAHQKLVWYTHKHICGLMKSRDESLIYAPQSELTEHELAHFGCIKENGEIIPVVVSEVMGIFTGANLIKNKARTAEILNAIKSPIERAYQIAFMRNQVVTQRNDLAMKLFKKEKELNAFYSINYIIVQFKWQDKKLELPHCARNILKTFLTLYTIYYAVKGNANYETSMHTQTIPLESRTLLAGKVRSTLEATKPVLQKLQELLDNFRKEGQDEEVWKLFTVQRAQALSLIEIEECSIGVSLGTRTVQQYLALAQKSKPDLMELAATIHY